jgi:hypothetical protein
MMVTREEGCVIVWRYIAISGEVRREIQLCIVGRLVVFVREGMKHHDQGFANGSLSE